MSFKNCDDKINKKREKNKRKGNTYTLGARLACSLSSGHSSPLLLELLLVQQLLLVHLLWPPTGILHVILLRGILPLHHRLLLLLQMPQLLLYRGVRIAQKAEIGCRTCCCCCNPGCCCCCWACW